MNRAPWRSPRSTPRSPDSRSIGSARATRRCSIYTAFRPAPSTGFRSSSGSAAWLPTCPGSAGRPSRATSTTRSPATTASSRRSPSESGWSASRSSCMTGEAPASSSHSASPSGSRSSSCSPRLPLLPGYRWHRTARGWRTPVIGELMMGFTTRRALRRELPRELADRAWEHFDQGTQRAILRLYRSAPPELLERSGARLGELRAPALILWPDDDPYIDAELRAEVRGRARRRDRARARQRRPLDVARAPGARRARGGVSELVRCARGRARPGPERCLH